MGTKIQGFFYVSMWLFLTVLFSDVIITSYRGHSEYLKEFKEFRGAVSRTMGGDYQGREQWVEPQAPVVESSEFKFEDLSKDDLEKLQNEVMTRLGEMTLQEKENRRRRK